LQESETGQKGPNLEAEQWKASTGLLSGVGALGP
jgi:hypothetical protein